jgi:hypothetical protein
VIIDKFYSFIKNINKFFTIIIALLSVKAFSQNTIPTTTCTGAMKINDSLNVQKDINSSGDIKASGEMVAKDTMRAQKDIIVDGNIRIGGDMSVSGDTKLVGRVYLPGTITQTATTFPDPCFVRMLAVDANTGELSQLNHANALNLDNALDLNPCPQAPIIPFVWQTYGNHVNSNNRWIGTIENFDFNIKTNSIYQAVYKANGDIGLGAYGGNDFNTLNKKYRFFIANNGEINAGIQDASNKYPFTIKPNGATYIGTERVSNGPHTDALLTVSGKMACKEIRVFNNGSGYWADFVFDKDYKLLPLLEVESYYKNNKHLPNMPTEKDIENNGNDLAKTDALLLQKIEELTLYIVQQQKEIEALKKQMINK